MTLYTLVNIFKKIALDQPNIRTTSDGSVYDALNNNPSVKYDVFHISQTNHQEDFETDYYGLQLFYISRLEDSLEDNRLQIQSIGKEVLGNIIRTFCENFSIDYPTITYIPFTQKFNDLTAGQYCNVRLEVPKDLVCADDFITEVIPGSGIKLQNIGITITENGLRVITPGPGYDGIGEIRIETDVPQSASVLQDKEVEYAENGSYTIHPDAGYDGLSSVAVDVDVPDRYDEGYEDGETDQKAKLSTTSVTENGTYTRADGYSAITVDVPQGQGYEEGYEDGVADQKAKLTVTSFTENNTYTMEDGWSAVTVNVPQTGQTINNQTKNIQLITGDFRLTHKSGGYFYSFKPNVFYNITYDTGYTGLEEVRLQCTLVPDDAIAVGENQQKAKMSALTVTTNGEYNREDGWSAVTVNVPSDYQDGYDDGEAAQKAKLSTTSVTENGTYTRADGYSAITVDVDDRYEEGFNDGFDYGYEVGYADGLEACSGSQITATSITLNVEETITDFGVATTTASPSNAKTNLTYSSSDTTKAIIDEFGNITVVSNGQVQFCVFDSISNLSDCKTVNVVKNENICYLTATYNIDTTKRPIEILNNTSSFSRAELADGTAIPLGTTYQFSSGGNQTIRYALTGSVIGDNAFYGIFHLVGISLPSCVTKLGMGSFRYTHLTNVVIPDSVTEIGVSCFSDCSLLKQVSIGDGMNTIRNKAFSYCFNLTAVTFGNSVRTIQASAFDGPNLQTVHLPSSILSIGSRAFTYGGLETVTIEATTPPEIGDSYPLATPDTIYVPAQSVSLYKSHYNWGNYKNIIQAIP